MSTLPIYTCPRCLASVPQGFTHTCGDSASSPATRADHGFALLALGERIARALESIAASFAALQDSQEEKR